ncbi:MAG: SMC-Scp complex subunit ScpB [Clostridia bacterium]|nr:SMC-Scp complex subunit ScpB [Clostridia bacterium]
MDYKKQQGIIESILFAAGRQVELKELMSATELGQDELIGIIEMMKNEYSNENRGIEIIKVNDSYQLCTKKENYEYIYPVFDKRSKPNLSPAALEVISIIAYNPKITRAEIEAIRGVSSDGSIYKLLEYELIQEAGRMDAPGRPTMYETSPKFLKMFGLSSLDELPELPRYKLDENQQIVIDEYIENNENNENAEEEINKEDNSADDEKNNVEE